LIVPPPFPGLPELIVIHDSVAVAVHVQPPAAETVMLELPADESKFRADGEIE
jgi:hypothetical protein